MKNEEIDRDLEVTKADEAEIKGGPKRIFIGGLSLAETKTELPDLEPQGELKGGPGGFGGLNLNHNETIEDLSLDEAEAELIVGGLNYIRKSGELKSEEKLPPPTTPISAPPPTRR